jgi:hypothetical protein
MTPIALAQVGVLLHMQLGALMYAMNSRFMFTPIMVAMGVESSRRALGLNYEPAEAGEWSWVFDARGKYRSVESNVAVTTLGQEGHARIRRMDLNAHMVSDRWVVSINMPYKNWEGYGAYEELGGQSLAIQVVPQYYIMKQDSEMFDFSVFAIGGYEHNWFDANPGIDDTDYVTWGVGALIGKTFCFGDLSLGYTYQPWINVDGDKELDGTDTMDYHRAELAYTVGLSKNLYGQLKAIWNHTEDLPATYDSDEYLGRVTLGYGTECWGVEASYGRTLVSDDYDEWDTDLSVFFRW